MQTGTSENTSVIEQLQNTFAAHTRTHAEHLAKDYLIKNPKEVAEFIGENLFLLELLEEIPARIRKYFGKSQELILQFFADPEDPNYHRLWVGIPTKNDSENSSFLLKEFDENWWFINERKSQSKILIDLESTK
ncbi:MAG: hypothetical protein HC846_04680 [Blastocatellia bacterium]|nr:hypothetical protein [Blastocatellia bacterium]